MELKMELKMETGNGIHQCINSLILILKIKIFLILKIG